MNENRRYEVRGTMALACKEQGDANLIDYDIARRSYEARKRLAMRQQRAAAADSRRSVTPRQQAEISHKRMTLQDAVESSYTPNRGMGSAVADMAGQLVDAIANHPFVEQARYGSLAGKETGKVTHRQVLSTSAVCMAISLMMVFVGV